MLPQSTKLVAEALRELIESKRARTAFYDAHGYKHDPEENSELRAVLDRGYAATERIEQLAATLYPEKRSPRAKKS